MVVSNMMAMGRCRLTIVIVEFGDFAESVVFY